jgi:hypothetical protein
MAIVQFHCIDFAGSRNPDDTPIGRLSLIININDVTQALVDARVHNTTGDRHKMHVMGHDFDAPHDPHDNEQVEALGPLGLLALVTPRGLRPGFSG